MITLKIELTEEDINNKYIILEIDSENLVKGILEHYLNNGKWRHESDEA